MYNQLEKLITLTNNDLNWLIDVLDSVQILQMIN